jgi:very-short-patch-repair endonuclease
MRRRAESDRPLIKWRAAKEKVQFARAMRCVPTAGEAALWAHVRRRGLGGWRFRRQHVIAGYIVDFYCAELQLAIEVDGAVHDVRRDEDEQRDENLARLGVHVVRVRDEDVRERVDVVLRALARRCETVAEHHEFRRHDGGRTPKG